MPALTEEDLIRRYMRGKSSKDQYRRCARRWFELGGPARQPSSADVRRYVSLRRQQGAADTTIDWELRAVRAMYRCSDMDVPVDAASLDLTRETRAALAPDLLEHLIACAKAGRFPPLTRGYLAVASVYGARVGEIRTLTTERVDTRSGIIRVQTLKKGVRRPQRIPEVMAWALRAPWRQASRAAAAARWHDMLRRAGVGPFPGTGWHAVRRALAVAFDDAGLPTEEWARFMRWSGPNKRTGSVGEAERYSHPTAIIGLRGVQRLADEDVDEAVWEMHPTVGLWMRSPREVAARASAVDAANK